MVEVKGYMRKKIVELTWPVVLEMFSIMIVNVLVTVMVGSLGAVPLAAVGLATMVQFSAAMVFAAAGTGAAAIVARETGAGNWQEVRAITGQALLLGLLFGCVLAAGGYWAAPHVFFMTGAEAAVAILAGDLLRLTFLFTPWYLVMAIGNAILRGLGKTRLAFWITLSSNVVSLLVCYLMIHGIFLPYSGPYGAAWGTGLYQLVGGVLACGVLFFSRQIRMGWQDVFVFRKAVIKRILDISVPAALEQLSLQGGRVAYTFLLAEVGAVEFAAHQIALQVESISFMPGFGFSVAAMTLVGQQLGRKLPHRAAQYAWQTNHMAFWLMTGMGVVFFLFATPLTRLFIQEPEVIYWGALCVMIAAFEQPTIALTYVFGGALRGAGDTKWPMYVTTLGVWCVRMPLIYLFINVWKYDITAAWYITAGDFLLRSMVLWRRFASNRWQKVQ